MNRILGVAAMVVGLGVATAASAAPVCPALDPCAGSCPILAQFDANCFAYETNYTIATYMSAPGSQMTIVGLITQFGGALSALNANDPNTEYTFVMTGLTSSGTVNSLNGPTTNHDTDYGAAGGATFAIYQGSPRNSPSTPSAWAADPFGGPVVPATHMDGTVILSGTLCGFHTNVAVTGSVVSGSFRAVYQATGGTMFNSVGNAYELVGGAWCANLSGCHPANYTAHPNGKFDGSAVTATSHSSWGRVKLIYR